MALVSESLERAGFRHGFFLREVVPDWDEACRSLDVARARLFLASQVHGRAVVSVSASDDPTEVRRREADAVLASEAGVACATRVADCAPVLLADPESGAVAAVHSGWRGTVQGVVAAAVEALGGAAVAPRLVAAVGPLIEVCCFEVGPEVAAELAASSPLGDVVVDRSRSRPHIDLRRVVGAQLRALGVEMVEEVRGCTRCDAARFHSFRRDGAASGRLLAAIVARGPGGARFSGVTGGPVVG
ncbi:MAG: polyphenol oxidase family protein [Deltaproteobacteria bacterium]|nr:polyphenol oxidase family protein [Deltaproteobacteria bacterium]